MSVSFYAPKDILSVWNTFDLFPMETLTKAWAHKTSKKTSQRTVPEMKVHRQKTGASGNCFDLALWLLHEFEQAGVHAYAVGESLGTVDAHVGVIALDENEKRFLCDLGDLWIQPIAIDESSKALHDGFFAGAQVGVAIDKGDLNIEYHRFGGKVSRQRYSLSPVSLKDLRAAGDVSQSHLSDPLVEMRIKEGPETVHWEFDGANSFLSRMRGLEEEPPFDSLADGSRRISLRTGMNAEYVYECLLFLEKNRARRA